MPHTRTKPLVAFLGGHMTIAWRSYVAAPAGDSSSLTASEASLKPSPVDLEFTLGALRE